MQSITDTFVGQALPVLIIAALGLALWSSKGPVMKIVGLMFMAFAVLQALGSPALMIGLGIVAAAYVVYRLFRHRSESAKRRQLCSQCGHNAHMGGDCQWRYCRC